MLSSQFVLGLAAKLVVDLFAGGGGASTGIEQAIGRPVDIAINHDANALALHRANHPQTHHLRSNVWDVDPLVATGGRPVGILWASPDCRHFSPAKGAAPVSDRVRSLAWVVIRWVTHCSPDTIYLENIPEFRNWGPVIAGRPCPDRKGKTFRRFVRQLERLGYDVETRDIRACEYGVPTIRKRLFMVAKRRGTGPIVWPQPTHGPGLLPYRTAADCIDWTIPCPSIFLTPEEAKELGVRRPLADATLRRIAHGVYRYVLDAAEPFIIPITHQGGDNRVGRHHGVRAPLPTITANSKGGEFALVSAFLTKFYGGVPQDGKTCAGAGAPMPTVTAWDHNGLVAGTLIKLRGTSSSRPADAPLDTISAGGEHHGAVMAFLQAYYGTDQDPDLRDPMHTVPTRDRFALVTVHGQRYMLSDIGLRMLTPRELFRAQGFADSYIIDRGLDEAGQWVKLTKRDQVRLVGNSVCPPLARMLVAANYSDIDLRQAA